MKWLKRIFYTGLVLVLGGVALLAGAWELSKRKPDWYPSAAPSAEAIAAAGSRVTNKVAGVQSWVASFHAKQVRIDKATTGPIGDTDADPEASKVITLTEEELNALFATWDTAFKWSEKYESQVADPMLVLQDERLILAASVRDASSVVSLHLEPKLDEAGKLRLRLVRVMGGRLPLPQIFWDRYRSTITGMIVRKLDQLRGRAAISDDGTANEAAVGTAMNRLLLQSINDEPADPVLFFPHNAARGKEGFPVKITAIGVKAKAITLTVVPMNREERAALLARLREPYPTEKPTVAGGAGGAPGGTH